MAGGAVPARFRADRALNYRKVIGGTVIGTWW